MSETAHALRQVSRATRSESMGIFYAQDTFDAIAWRDRLVAKRVDIAKKWTAVFGQLAPPRVRSLRIAGLGYFLRIFSGMTHRQIFIRTTHTTKPIYIELEKKDGGYYLHIEEADLNALVLNILWPQGELELTAERIELLLVAMLLVPDYLRLFVAEDKAEVLGKLATKAGQEELMSDSKC